MIKKRLGSIGSRCITFELRPIEQPKCPHCHGKGKVRYYHGDLDTCPTCHGTGFIEQPKQLEAVIVVPIDPTAEATIKRNHDFVSVLIGNTEYRKASVVIRQRKTEGQDG